MWASLHSCAKKKVEGLLHTFGVQHARDVQILFGNVEGKVQVFQWIVL